MLNDLSDLEMIVKVYDKALNNQDEEIDGRAVDLAIGVKLADMIKKESEIFFAVTGDTTLLENKLCYQLEILKIDGNHHFIMFLNKDIAVQSGLGYLELSLEKVLKLVRDTPQMKGIMLIKEIGNPEDIGNRKFSTLLITKNMAAIALRI